MSEALKAAAQVLGLAPTITSGLSLAALALLICFLLAWRWAAARDAHIRQAIASGDARVITDVLGDPPGVPLDQLPPADRLAFAREQLRSRFFARFLRYAAGLFALVAVLIFAAWLAKDDDPSPASSRRDWPWLLGMLRFTSPDVRMEACARLASAAECEANRDLVMSIAPQRPTPAQEAAVERVIEQGPGALASVSKSDVADLAACGGSFDFQVAGDRLTCPDGDPVPQLASSRTSALLAAPDALVFHSSATPGASFEALARFLSGEGGSGPDYRVHLLVSRSGSVVQIAPFDRRGAHTGPATMVDGLLIGNANSIGVEMVNRGAGSGEPFTPEQTAAAKGVARALAQAYPLKAVVGHSDLAPGRKTDPGPLFPMSEVRRAAGLTAS